MRILLYLLLCLCAHPALAADLRVYTAAEPDMLAHYKTLFAKAHPEISVSWLREGTGTITARLLAEKQSPRADVVFALAAVNILELDSADMLEPYSPAGAAELLPAMKDSRNRWFGLDAWGAALCVNLPELQRRNLPEPHSWEALTDPRYAGLIAMPNPAASGTGYANVAAWIANLGDKGWELMERLHANAPRYTLSGAAPCAMTARGEVVIGVSSGAFAANLLRLGAPIRVIIPEDGANWEIEGVALLKHSPNQTAAKIFMDWATSPEVAAVAAKNNYIPARQDALTPELRQVLDAIKPLAPEWSAQNKAALLKLWKDRFEQR